MFGKKVGLGTLALAVAGVSLLGSSAARASTWTGGANNNWDNLSNWDSNPSGGLGAVDTLTNYPIITANNTVVPNDINIGDTVGTTGRLDVRAGTLSYGYWSKVGDYNGNGTLNIADTTKTGGTYTGFGLGTGSYVSQHAADNNNLFVGLYQSTGVVNMNTTGHLDAQNLFISANSSDNLGSGTFNLDAGTVNVSAALQVGSDMWGACGKDATFNMSGGTVNVGGALSLGRYNNTISKGTSTLNMTGGTVNVENDLVVGLAGLAGTKSIMNIANGATVNVASTSERWVILTQWDSTDGTINVTSGGTLKLNAGTDIRTGIENNNGTRLINVDGGSIIGTGPEVSTKDASVIEMGRNSSTGSDTLNIKNGGSVQIQSIFTNANTTSAIINFDRGTLKAIGNDANLINLAGTGIRQVNVMAGGATIDSNGFDVTIHNGLLAGDAGHGGLTKNGAGTLTLTGVNTYTGDTTVHGGTLALASGAELKFVIGANGVSNKISIDTGASATLDGIFNFDLSGAGTTLGDQWTIANGATFGSTFAVSSFTDAGNDVWTKAIGDGSTAYRFSEITGTLQVISVPEPVSLGLLAMSGLALLARRRKIA